MTTDTTIPTLAPGVTHLEASSPRTPALHQLTLAALGDLEGRAYWIDSRSAAATHAWLESTVSSDELDRLRIARAFTAYQHHSLVQTARERAGADDLLVVPALDALYADDDVPEPQARLLRADTLDAIDAIAARGATVLVTAGDDLGDRADHTIAVRETDLGIAYEGDSFETTLYRGPGYWQTTIPYWVDLLGIHDPDEAAVVPTVGARQCVFG